MCSKKCAKPGKSFPGQTSQAEISRAVVGDPSLANHSNQGAFIAQTHIHCQRCTGFVTVRVRSHYHLLKATSNHVSCMVMKRLSNQQGGKAFRWLGSSKCAYSRPRSPTTACGKICGWSKAGLFLPWFGCPTVCIRLVNLHGQTAFAEDFRKFFGYSNCFTFCMHHLLPRHLLLELPRTSKKYSLILHQKKETVHLPKD